MNLVQYLDKIKSDFFVIFEIPINTPETSPNSSTIGEPLSPLFKGLINDTQLLNIFFCLSELYNRALNLK